MKIVFGDSLDAIAEHAKKVVAESNFKSRAPKGIAAYSAQVPSVCEDCGQTYWHGSDEYIFYPHIGCKGKKGSAGF